MPCSLLLFSVWYSKTSTAPTVIHLCFLPISVVVSHFNYEVQLQEAVNMHVIFNIQNVVIDFGIINPAELLSVLLRNLEDEV